MSSMSSTRRNLASASSTSRSSGSFSRQSNLLPGQKLPVAEPTSVGKFIVILAMHLCRKVLLVDTSTKLGIYICVITLVSLLVDLFPFPRTFFSDKRNPLNIYFVKWGWGWTCTLLGIFIYLTSHTYCGGDRKAINRHLSRLAVATSWWFICTRLFTHIQETVGHCSPIGAAATPSNVADAMALDRDACEIAGHRWLAFDVSGHAFLLIHCLLTISEEVRCIAGWERIDELAAQEQQNSDTSRLSGEQLDSIRSSYASHTPYIRLMMVVLSLLVILWDIMLLATAIYFHNLPQKLTGAAFAALGWFLSYRVWYTPATANLTNWTPGPTGRGLIKYQKKDTL